MKKRKVNKYVQLINKFVDLKFFKRTDWPREVKIAKRLLESDEMFFSKISLDFKLNSLAWFSTENGKEFIMQQKLQHSLNLKVEQPVELEDKAFGENLNLKKKPVTIQEFLKYGKK